MNIQVNEEKKIASLYFFSFLNFVGIMVTIVICTHEYEDVCIRGIPLDTILPFITPLIQLLFIYGTSKAFDSLSSTAIKPKEKYALYIVSYIFALLAVIVFWIVWFVKLKNAENDDIHSPDTIRRIINPILFPLGIIVAEFLPLNTPFGTDTSENNDSIGEAFKSLWNNHRRSTISYILPIILLVLFIILFLIQPLIYKIFVNVCWGLLAVLFISCTVSVIKSIRSNK